MPPAWTATACGTRSRHKILTTKNEAPEVLPSGASLRLWELRRRRSGTLHCRWHPEWWTLRCTARMRPVPPLPAWAGDGRSFGAAVTGAAVGRSLRLLGLGVGRLFCRLLSRRFGRGLFRHALGRLLHDDAFRRFFRNGSSGVRVGGGVKMSVFSGVWVVSLTVPSPPSPPSPPSTTAIISLALLTEASSGFMT